MIDSVVYPTFVLAHPTHFSAIHFEPLIDIINRLKLQILVLLSTSRLVTKQTVAYFFKYE